MKQYTEKEKEKFLLNLSEELFNQGDNYFAFISKKGKWHFGYTNDSPLQHGKGDRNFMPDELVNLLMNKLNY